MKRVYLFAHSLLVFTLAFGVLLSGCATPTDTPTSVVTERVAPTLPPTPANTPTPKPTLPPISCNALNGSYTNEIKPKDNKVGGYFDNQIIITGVGEVIEKTINDVNSTLIASDTISGADPLIVTTNSIILEQSVPQNIMINIDGTPYSLNGLNKVTIGLYFLIPNDEITVWDIVNLYNRKALEYFDLIDPNNLLFSVAEPNYVIRNPDDPLNNPFIEGYPGSPGIEGGPFELPLAGNTLYTPFVGTRTPTIEGGPRSPGIEGDTDPFLSQWAVGQISLTVPFPDPSPSQDVYIAVFDTSPLSQTNDLIDVGWVPRDFNICVSDIITNYSTIYTSGITVPLTEHGFSVASLIRLVNPNPDVILIQSLDDHLKGSLFSFLGAFQKYNEYIETLVDGKAAPKLVNLSLGFELNTLADTTKNPNDVNPKVLPSVSSSIERIRSIIDVLGSVLPVFADPIEKQGTPPPPKKVKIPIFSLQVALARYEGLGYLIVAAAGNNGEDHPQAPASYPTVVGVAASNFSGQKSCFSNYGKVTAPGGDGTKGDSGCTVNWADCDDYCFEYGVTCLVRKPEASQSGHAYWTGTSFSTPLVSGLAALIWSTDRDLKPAEIRQLIYECATDSTSSGSEHGIINVMATMEYLQAVKNHIVTINDLPNNHCMP